MPPNENFLVLVHSAYGERMGNIASVHRIFMLALRFPENAIPGPEMLA